MPGPFHGIFTASSALRAFQRAMETTGNNLANVNTRGYSRQITELRATEPSTIYSNGRQLLGTGVAISAISRAREMFLESRMSAALSDQARYGTLSAGLRELEGIYREPGEAGIGHALDRFFNSWSALGSNPSDTSARQAVRDAGSLLASRVRGAHAEMRDLEFNTQSSITETLDSVDDLTLRLSQLNNSIRAETALGGTPNSLLDERDQLVERLSSLVQITSSVNADGTMNIMAGNKLLVHSAGRELIPRSYDPAAQTLTDGTNTFQVRGGQLLGQMQTLTRLRASMVELDTLANTLRTEFNKLHAGGTNALGNMGVAFFNDATPPDPQTGAIDFDLSADILGDVRAIAAGTSGAAGDGSLALQLSRLRQEKLAGLGDRTIQEFYRGAVSALSNEVESFASQADTFAMVAEQVDAQRQSISGVNIDEEMADLMRYQRSFQAAARVLTVMDQMTEELVNMVRR